MIKSDLDRLDRRILNHLQRDNQISNVLLAETIGLSPPACLRRVKRLRKSGAITADVSLLSQEVTGHKINIVVEVEMDRDQYALASNFRKAVLAAPEVTQCYSVTGEIDYILILSVADMQSYEAFTHQVLNNEPNLRRFRSLISLKRVKFETAQELPLD
ncbi:MAG: Lrp/AsnC family transcriptional regulator [Gammaproteobacteria bacterium]|nr:Lrp/AsnC family transcriptional regulator [Gammaproteobacteria bacterium]